MKEKEVSVTHHYYRFSSDPERAQHELLEILENARNMNCDDDAVFDASELTAEPHLISELAVRPGEWTLDCWELLQNLLQKVPVRKLKFLASNDVNIMRGVFDNPGNNNDADSPSSLPIPLRSFGTVEVLEWVNGPMGPLLPCLRVPMSLKELIIESSTISEHEARLLADFLQRDTTGSFVRPLERLDLNGTRLVDEAARHLAWGFRHCGGVLIELCLTECNLMDEQIGIIVNGLVDCCVEMGRDLFALEDLDISFNKARENSVRALSRLLRETRLKKLRMGFQAFGAGSRIDLTQLFTAVASNTSLIHWEIGGKSLRDEDTPILIRSLTENKTLKVLDLSENRFTNMSVEALASSFGSLSVEELILEDIRDLNWQSIKILADSISSCGSLYVIEVGESLQTEHEWEKLTHKLDVNWSIGGRAFLQTHHAFDVEAASCHGYRVPVGSWPFLLERINFPDAHEFPVQRHLDSPSVVYHLIQHFLSPIVLSGDNY